MDFIRKGLFVLCLTGLPLGAFARSQPDAKPGVVSAADTALFKAAYATYIVAVQSGRLDRMRSEQRLLLLTVSLSPQQWKVLGSSRRLGLEDVTPEQAPLFLSLLPDRFCIRTSVLKEFRLFYLLPDGSHVLTSGT